MNSTDIKHSLTNLFSNYEYKLYNTYIFGTESDFFAISKSGYCIEVEIKISKADFKNDFKKTTFKSINFTRVNKHEYLQSNDETFKPNKFYFACPDGLLKESEIPVIVIE
jgi:hypothetical protein